MDVGRHQLWHVYMAVTVVWILVWYLLLHTKTLRETNVTHRSHAIANGHMLFLPLGCSTVAPLASTGLLSNMLCYVAYSGVVRNRIIVPASVFFLVAVHVPHAQLLWSFAAMTLPVRIGRG